MADGWEEYHSHLTIMSTGVTWGLMGAVRRNGLLKPRYSVETRRSDPYGIYQQANQV